MIRLDKKLNEEKNLKSKMLLQIHDELIFEVPKKEQKAMVELIQNEMTSVTQRDYHYCSTPLTDNVNVGDNWGIFGNLVINCLILQQLGQKLPDSSATWS